jgi:hypothetical protein
VIWNIHFGVLMMHTYFVNDEVYSIQHYVINLSVTCDRSMVFFGYSCFPTNKTGCHDITEILLKVTLSTITLTLLTGTWGLFITGGGQGRRI